MSWNDHCLPVRSSATVKVPLLSPTSLKSWPSRPAAPRPSSQANSEANSGSAPREPSGGAAPARATAAGSAAIAEGTADGTAEAVTKGRLLAPANTVTRLSDSMRTASSAPTRLSRSARIRPVINPEAEMPTSALGALATTVPSGSRTTMSRMRSAVRPPASRSSWVPPTST